ncbi:hypothetical protein [Massilia sp. YIM B04103]|uniref:hypothetical protein n=1 Tax=Massilia sp. YIM B04103 TaxID=2963106 RepID=UPI0021088B3F|nr:hypothetical protein [Massilia sp. YIM B04103]
MGFTWSFKTRFAHEFSNYPRDQQDKILDFIALLTQHGLTDFGKFSGKFSASWKGLASSDPAYAHARSNELWHYHIGIPRYRNTRGKDQTSDWILHFQWPHKNAGGTHIDLVDICYHYKADGSFYLPAAGYLL